jgi:bifunctional oligoribonuclease and PAP phosphatase NrnA
MDLSNLADRFKEAIAQYKSFLVMSHQRPDGDAVGSSLAMALALQNLGKAVEVWNEDPLPKKFDFLPAGNCWRVTPAAPSHFDVIVSVDNANKKRLGRAVDMLTDAKMWINIDHHASNERFGDLNIVDPDSPATGEILCRLFKDAGIAVSRDMAVSLFVAISTDTGSFMYPATTAQSFRIAADLVEKGLKVGDISKIIYESYPLGRFKLMQRFLAKAAFRANSRISYSWIQPEDYRETQAAPEDSEGLIDMIRAIDTVVASVMFEKLEDGKIRMSLRSKDPHVDVNKIAQKFGGGGHALAAGARTSGTPEEIQEKVLSEMEKLLKK